LRDARSLSYNEQVNTELLQLTADELLQRYTALQLDEIAQRAAGVQVQSRLLTGRCLLAFHRGNLGWCAGVSGWLHYAIEVLGCNPREARDLYWVARRLEELPLLSQAAQDGTIRWSHLLAVVSHASVENEARLLDLACNNTICKLRKLLRGALPDEEDDSHELRVSLDPVLAATLAQIRRELGEEAGRPLSMSEVIQCLCAQRLTGTAFPDERVWNSATREAHRDGDPEVLRNARLHFNEEARLLTPAQRRELLRRDGYRCCTPGCPNTLWLQAHHIRFYSEGGLTELQNLLTECSRCHRNIHAGHLHVSGRAPNGLTWTDRNGAHYERRGLTEPSGWFQHWWGAARRAPPVETAPSLFRPAAA
jgi:hypothetical protein